MITRNQRAHLVATGYVPGHPGRPKRPDPMRVVSVRLPAILADWIDEQCRATGVSRTDWIVETLARAVDKAAVDTPHP